MAALGGIALDIAVAKETLLLWLLVTPSEADDDNVNMRHAASVATPCEGAVSEADFHFILVEEKGPKLGNLFPLGN